MSGALAAAVLLGGPTPVPPPGVDPQRYRAALAEDTFEVVQHLRGVAACLAATTPDDLRLAQAIAWPGTPVLEVDRATPVVGVLDALAARGCGLGVVLAPDAPDLPGLLVGKLFSALEDVAVSVLPAQPYGLVGLGARLPLSDWLRTCRPDLDAADAVEALHAAAPQRQVVVGPGWHRLREPGDVARLDPRLEGWDATRTLLSAGT